MEHPQTFLLLVLMALAVTCASAQSRHRQVCGNVPYVWRNNNMSCPHVHAVCADVFNTRRDWFNGTACQEKRVLHNCMCPGNSLCPVNSDAHKVYSTRQHTQYLCQPVCTLPYCQNIRMTPRRGHRRVDPIFPMTSVQNAPEFGNRTYTKLDCRCPRHHYPVQAAGVHRAVTSYTHRWDAIKNTYSTFYICRGYRGEH
ncbi:hypothetical protein PoB_002472300 [Plakobranchus ocellatus]|uniref:Uncharacterized protein n=1 Tax=Plakobranchus ocellatus TaxID=259542 RepID=A0AAV3ZUV0_9GAST|nr:hypothetical protein PoB_002472300 [Plakobranchus ocellatus]